ncbi:N-acetylmuramidase domain-containing protein [Tardiphaga sp.]|uniref:N-acetylmuramidase domain-containing protein n=1 Tax=Tardiphaga sp. TaxID=1926292 RepID=UPI00352B70F7
MADDPIDQIDDAMAALRAKIQGPPPPPDKANLEAAYSQLGSRRDEYVGNAITAAMVAVGKAAAALQAVVESANTDPIEIFQAKFAKAADKLQIALPDPPDAHLVSNKPLGHNLAAAPSFMNSGLATPLTKAGLQNACQQLGVKAAEVWAIVFTETDPPYCGFWADGRPQILFERHIFHRLTAGKYSASNPDISNAESGNYGASGKHQYDRLAQAMALDESAALQSASWGISQTLGTNYRRVGFSSPQEMVKAMFLSEDEQLLAGVRGIQSSNIAVALQTHDWKGFASVYNGSGYWRNNYDDHLRSWYEKLSSGASPDLDVRAAQVYLMYLGLDPSTIDGVWGKRTQSAVNIFRGKQGLAPVDSLDDQTLSCIASEASKAIGFRADLTV